MPRRNQVLSTVLQTVLLFTCTSITSHHLWISANGKFTSIELYKNYTEASKLLIKVNDTAARTSSNETTLTVDGPDAVNVTTITANNGSSTSPAHARAGTETEREQESFYKHKLPRVVVAYTILSLLGYFWQLTLERLFPARPRPALSLHREVWKDKDGGDDDQDSREEEVVKKWIAQGKVRRASLSWCNTLIKWLLDVVVGGLWIAAVSCFMGRLFEAGASQQPGRGMLEGLKGQVLITWVLSLIGTRTLASFIAMIVIPAHKRIVFVAALDLAMWTFIGLFANLLVPWVASTDFGQAVLTNMTESIRKSKATRLTDEL